MRQCAVRLSFCGALMLYGISFFLPVAEGLAYGDGVNNGWSAFLFCVKIPFEGEMIEKPFRGLAFVACLSNLLAIIGFGSWLARKWRCALLAGYLALLFAIQFQFYCVCGAVWESLDPSKELFGAGYWVWVISFAVLVVASCAGMVCSQGSSPHLHSSC
jgi:hypothetical protein